MTSNSIIQVANIGNTHALANVQHATTDDLHGDQVFLVLRIFDITPSMDDHIDELIKAERENIKALKDSASENEFLISTWLFNSKSGFIVLDGFVPIDDVTPLDRNLCKTDGITNLFDTVYTGITDPHAGVMAYAKQLSLSGITPKVAVAVFTDGGDNASRTDPQEIKNEVNLAEGYYFTLFAFGVGFGPKAAKAMGFPNCAEHDALHGNIRKLMGTFSKSLVRASQTTVAPNSFIA
ncbi:hypothetical protein A2572_03190 [Candidatus Collierbacteria bacterium RIFOXYD1_FULL_40_9]|uniref:VWFA domain-containing protein n=1 Tax=Candidatus Collierbacteria bacterium RIFOXYD1_FULL_40_9 TaxID=1817731 RepID=A0A1F5FWV7_9BACT|nr:MAG: hypothetical protein A2572_03190 [Candidatus Collierbacteria bacterium RIFOXYD1_FULL_40_9]